MDLPALSAPPSTISTFHVLIVSLLIREPDSQQRPCSTGLVSVELFLLHHPHLEALSLLKTVMVKGWGSPLLG